MGANDVQEAQPSGSGPPNGELPAPNRVADAGDPNRQADPSLEPLKTVYDQLCVSYRAIDETRARLLGLLPLATGAGLVALAGTAADSGKAEAAALVAAPISFFGLLITLGLFSYELHGIKKCGHLIRTGHRIEDEVFHAEGQFRTRPHEFLGFIDEPFAASVIYPASLAAWVFFGLAFLGGSDKDAKMMWLLEALVASVGTFGFGFWWSLSMLRSMEEDLNSDPNYEGNRRKLYNKERYIGLFARHPR